MDADTGYRPIACDFHDQLEAFAVTRRRVRITQTSGDREGLIKDIYTTDRKEEFLLLDDGTAIRLDLIQAVTPAS